MPVTFDDDDDDRSGLADREYPDSRDIGNDDEDDVDTEPCPHCGEPVYDQSQRCPHCGQYMTPGSAVKKPRWFVVGVIACVVIVVLSWILLRGG